MHIAKLQAREILDSRGNPTIEASILLDNGMQASASVPSGASTGSKEACELRDDDPKRYGGKGVLQAISHINSTIHDHLKGCSVADQLALDQQLIQLDGTPNKSRLGANAILAVSLAAARARAQILKLPLYAALQTETTMAMPMPMMNVLNGGAHADNNVDIQEFMLIPKGATDFPSAIQMGTEIFHTLKAVLKKQGLNTAVGDEGGFAPNLQSNRQALDILSLAIEKAGFSTGKDVLFALDVAASELYSQGRYTLASENKTFTSEELVDYYTQLINSYPIVSIEDGLDEQDWSGWKHLTQVLGNKIQLVGDDLFVTNAQLVREGISQQVANAVLIKPNQIGTLSETIETMATARAGGYHCIVSHRSGETEDTFIADLAVSSGCGQIKTGSLCRTDRTAKYNQLLRIYEATQLPFLPF